MRHLLGAGLASGNSSVIETDANTSAGPALVSGVKDMASSGGWGPVSECVPSCVCVCARIHCVCAHAYAFKIVVSSSSFILAALKWSDGLLLLKLCLELRFGITLSKKPRQILSNILEVNKAASLGPDPFLVGGDGGQWSVIHHLELLWCKVIQNSAPSNHPYLHPHPLPLHGHSSS